MSSSIMRIKPEEVGDVEKRGQYTVSVIGCNEIGILQACLFADAGFKTICADADNTIVNGLAKGKYPFSKREVELKLRNHVKTGRIKSTTNFRTSTSQSDVTIITIPVKFDEKKRTNYSEIENACKQIGSGLRRESLVIVFSTVGLGFIEGTVKEVLENTSGLKAGTGFGLAYSPVQIPSEPTLENLAKQERIVAASDKNSLNSASIVLETITKSNIKKIEEIKTAEVAALFETVQQDAQTALTSEFAQFCEKAGVDYLETCKLTRVSSHPMHSLTAITSQNIREEPYLFLEDAENLNLKLRIPAISRVIMEETSKHVINLVKDALKSSGKTLRRARISLLGISQVPNIKSPPKKIVKEISETLEARGARVSLYDPYFSSDELSEVQHRFKKSLNEALEGADCILILTGHDQFKRQNLKKLRITMKAPAVIVDLEGIVEPDKVEKEGFIYRGLGRGVWTK